MTKKSCECSSFIDGLCIAEKCILNAPRFITQSEAEKIGFELQQVSRKRSRAEDPFPPSSVVFWILRKFNIRRKEGDLE